MDLRVSEQHLALQNEVRAFIAAHGHLSPPPNAGGGRGRPDAAMLDWQRRLIEHGYAARNVPREYGGYGAESDVLASAIIAEEFNKAGISPGIQGQGIRMLVPTLLEVGTEEQRRRLIAPTIRGDIVWCQGYSEPQAGSDLASLRTSARVEDGDFVINGQKIWTSGAHLADMIFLLCRTELQSPKHRGISYLLLSMSTPGIEVRPLVTMTEQATFNEVFFTDVRVPVDQIVMGRGDGWKVANVTLKHERVMLADSNKLMRRVHKLQVLFETTTIDGIRLMDMAEYRDRLMRLHGEVLAAKLHQMRLVSEAARGEDSGVGLLVVKYQGSMLAWKLAALGVDALGAAGLPYEPDDPASDAHDSSAWYTDYMFDLGLVIGGGSSNIQKNIIAERGLNMPREPQQRSGV